MNDIMYFVCVVLLLEHSRTQAFDDIFNPINGSYEKGTGGGWKYYIIHVSIVEVNSNENNDNNNMKVYFNIKDLLPCGFLVEIMSALHEYTMP